MTTQQKIVRALILYLFNWWRIYGKRVDFDKAMQEYKSLLQDLEAANASDTVKNEILERSVVRIMFMRDKLHER